MLHFFQDETHDKFNQMQWNPSTSGAAELIEADEPEMCDLTPVWYYVFQGYMVLVRARACFNVSLS